MKFYLIFEASQPGTKRTRPTFIVWDKAVAKAICKEFHCFYYEERETESESDTLTYIEHSDYFGGNITPFSKGLFSDISCPHCGAKHFIVGGSSSTAMYCPTIVKDGKVISEDRNISTTEYRCLECGKTFKTVNGKVEKIND